MDFYNEIAGFYDQMTRFDSRVNKEKNLFSSFLQHYPIKTAIDLSCGSGLHTIVLNQLGVTTTGIDISSEMLELARQNASQYGIHADFISQSMEELNVSQPADALLCLGNSIPHLQNESALKNVLKRAKDSIHSGGWIVLQILNYSKILEKQERIVAIHETENKTFIRFYDFLESCLQFNILMIEKTENSLTHTLNNTQLQPFTHHTLIKNLDQTGFTNIKLFGNLEFSSFDPSTSANLVILANRP